MSTILRNLNDSPHKLMRRYTNEEESNKNMKNIKILERKRSGIIYTREDREHLECIKVNITDLYRSELIPFNRQLSSV